MVRLLLGLSVFSVAMTSVFAAGPSANRALKRQYQFGYDAGLEGRSSKAPPKGSAGLRNAYGDGYKAGRRKALENYTHPIPNYDSILRTDIADRFRQEESPFKGFHQPRSSNDVGTQTDLPSSSEGLKRLERAMDLTAKAQSILKESNQRSKSVIERLKQAQARDDREDKEASAGRERKRLESLQQHQRQQKDLLDREHALYAQEMTLKAREEALIKRHQGLSKDLIEAQKALDKKEHDLNRRKAFLGMHEDDSNQHHASNIAFLENHKKALEERYNILNDLFDKNQSQKTADTNTLLQEQKKLNNKISKADESGNETQKEELQSQLTLLNKKLSEADALGQSHSIIDAQLIHLKDDIKKIDAQLKKAQGS